MDIASTSEDALATYYSDILDSTYDCTDRIVLNAYFPVGHSPAGFRHWWRNLHSGSDDDLDNNHLMRMAGRFRRRLNAYTEKEGIPIVDCTAGERKHELAERYLPSEPEFRGVFLVLVSRAPAPVWDVVRGNNGIVNIAHKKSLPYVNHYSFHIMDPDWGHITIKICGHPPFPAQIILNGHEYVAAQTKKAGHPFTKEGNCFTEVTDAQALAQVADTLCSKDAIGRLSQICNRWIYSACLCFALSAEEREVSGFEYRFSIYQAEFSRNLLFHSGAQMDQVFDSLIDRNRSWMCIDRIKTILGLKKRPNRKGKKTPRWEVLVENPAYNLTIFKIHFGALTLKAYTKGEHVLRFEIIVNNVGKLGCGRVLDRFPEVISYLKGVMGRFLSTLSAIDAAFLSDATWEQLPLPSQVGKTRVGGIDLQKPRLRTVTRAVTALAASPNGFTASQLADKVRSLSSDTGDYRPTHAAYDLKKLRGKQWVRTIQKSRRYEPTFEGLQSMAAVLTLHDKIIKPILAVGSSATSTQLKSIGMNLTLDSQRRGHRIKMNGYIINFGLAV